MSKRRKANETDAAEEPRADRLSAGEHSETPPVTAGGVAPGLVEASRPLEDVLPEHTPRQPGSETAAPAGPVRLPNGQFIGQPGSNGGVHRGRDRFPRANVVRAKLLSAMGSQEPLPRIDPMTGRIVLGSDGKPVMVAVEPMQMVTDDVTAYRLISRRAALGHGLDQFLKMMKDTHEIMQETKAEEARGEERSHQTSAARFILPDGTDLVPQPGQEKKPDEPTNGVERDGQVYEDPDAE